TAFMPGSSPSNSLITTELRGTTTNASASASTTVVSISALNSPSHGSTTDGNKFQTLPSTLNNTYWLTATSTSIGTKPVSRNDRPKWLTMPSTKSDRFPMLEAPLRDCEIVYQSTCKWMWLLTSTTS